MYCFLDISPILPPIGGMPFPSHLHTPPYTTPCLQHTRTCLHTFPFYVLSILATVVALESNNFPLPKVMARGHLPGAINVTPAVVLNTDTREFKEPEDIKTGKERERGLPIVKGVAYR